MDEDSCKECNVCSSVCPIVEIDPSRKISDVFSIGDFDPWPCCSCHLCEDSCPEGLSPRDRMFALRPARDSLKTGSAGRIQRSLAILKERGFLLPINEESNQARKDLALPEIDIARISENIKRFFKNLEQYRERSSTEEPGAGAG